ncbi:MAG: hypothetical protein LBB76_00630, partial [Azoarcus sp.]|nr:hypothetical protein [Azoarcus sp.]
EVSGLYANFYAWGSHLGEAWHKAYEAALAEKEIIDPVLMEAYILQSLDDINYEGELSHLAPDVYRIPANILYPLDDPEPLFVPPTGVVPTDEDRDAEPPLQACFASYTGEEYTIVLAATKDALEPTFAHALHLLPNVVGMGIGVQGHWERKLNEWWINKTDFKTAEAVLSFFAQARQNTLENGFLDLVVFAQDGETRLMLSEHKTLNLYTKDEKLFRRVVAEFISLGYAHKEDCISMAYGHHHWHYRPAGSLERKKFAGFLRKYRFELLETWKDGE